MRCTKNDPGRKANEMCMRKPTSCDTCFAEADAGDGGHSERITRSLSRLGDGKVTVSDSVSMNQPNTSRRVSQSVIFLRGGSEAPRLSNRRKYGPRQVTAPPSSSGDNPATTAPQPKYRRLRNTVRRNSSPYCHLSLAQAYNHAGGTQPASPATEQDGRARRQRSLAGMQQRLDMWSECVRMFERRRNQSPKPGGIPPPELQTKIHDHGTADHVPKSRCPRRLDRNLPRGVLKIGTTQEDPSGTIVLDVTKTISAAKRHAERDHARKVARKKYRYRH